MDRWNNDFTRNVVCKNDYSICPHSNNGIKTTLIVDAAAAYIMDKVDCVLLGAEGIAETGGILNRLGSYTLAVCAKARNKPVYVLAESVKFIKLFTLLNGGHCLMTSKAIVGVRHFELENGSPFQHNVSARSERHSH